MRYDRVVVVRRPTIGIDSNGRQTESLPTGGGQQPAGILGIGTQQIGASGVPSTIFSALACAILPASERYARQRIGRSVEATETMWCPAVHAESIQAGDRVYDTGFTPPTEWRVVGITPGAYRRLTAQIDLERLTGTGEKMIISGLI